MVRKIKWTIRALSDLHDIHEYIAKDSKQYAQIQIENIQNAVSNLLSFPMIGHKIPELPHLQYREILVGNYRVVYRLENKQDLVIVTHISHILHQN
jgi:addiction module RelE/StbE family toxin